MRAAWARPAGPMAPRTVVRCATAWLEPVVYSLSRAGSARAPGTLRQSPVPTVLSVPTVPTVPSSRWRNEAACLGLDCEQFFPVSTNAALALQAKQGLRWLSSAADMFGMGVAAWRRRRYLGRSHQ